MNSIKKQIETIGELKEFIKSFADDTPIKLLEEDGLTLTSTTFKMDLDLKQMEVY